MKDDDIADILLIHEKGIIVPDAVVHTLKRNDHFYDVLLQEDFDVNEAIERIDSERHRFVCLYFENDIANILLIIKSLRHYATSISIFLVLPTFSDFDEAEVKRQAFKSGATEVVQEHKLELLRRHVNRYIDHFKPRAGRILYVHHDERQIKDQVAALKKRGYKVDIRATAEEAWVSYRHNRFDLVLTSDMLKGVGSSSNLIANIRRLPDDSGTRPILIMLSDISDNRENILLDLGGNEVLSYPIDTQSLLFKVGAHITNTRRVKSSRFNQDSSAPLLDKVTGSLSRQAISFMWPVYISMTLRNASNMSVALISVEGLAGLRDKYTTNEVNHVLHSVAEIIRQNLRVEDVMARWSEDTFAVFIMDCIEEVAISVVKRSIRDATQSLHLHDKLLGLNGGLVGSHYFLSSNIESVVEEARAALTEASSRGSGYVVNYSEIN